MRYTNIRKALAAAALLGATAFGAAAWADPEQGGYGPGYGPGYGMGPGMMWGYGPGGTGGYGPGYGMGPGMMGGFGYGPGYGMGPGMMGGYGPGYGMGPGMMWGYGQGYGMGPGMMWGYGANALDLSDEQRDKIAKIQDDTANKQWELMEKMQDERLKLREFYASGKRDDAAVNKSFKQLSELRRQMFDNGRNARKEMDAVLTKEQRDRLRRGYGAWGY